MAPGALTIEAGGQSTEFGGSGIFISGTLEGVEGNGVVQLAGIYSQISWNNPIEGSYTLSLWRTDAGACNRAVPGS